MKLDFTYLLYNCILLFAFLFSYLAEKLDTKEGRLFFRFLVFSVLLIPAALRYNTGTDYMAYYGMFSNPVRLEKCELLWQLLNKTVHFMGLSVQWVFVFAAALIYFPICFILKRRFYCISVSLYILLTFYFKSYNILRQMISVSFILYTIIRLEDKKYFSSIITFLIALGFHTSALIFIPCFILSIYRIKIKQLPVIIMFVGILLILKINILQIMFKILALVGSNYARFAAKSFYVSRTSLGSGIGVFTKLLFSILSVIFYNAIVSKYPHKKIALTISCIYIWAFLLAAQYVILGRVRDLFIYAPLLVTGEALQQTGRYRKVIAIALIGLNLILFEKDIGKQTRDVFSNSIYPYYSIYYKGGI